MKRSVFADVTVNLKRMPYPDPKDGFTYLRLDWTNNHWGKEIVGKPVKYGQALVGVVLDHYHDHHLVAIDESKINKALLREIKEGSIQEIDLDVDESGSENKQFARRFNQWKQLPKSRNTCQNCRAEFQTAYPERPYCQRCMLKGRG